jgi:hypothetical protein
LVSLRLYSPLHEKKRNIKKGKERSGENSASHIGGRWSARDEKAPAHKRIYYS